MMKNPAIATFSADSASAASADRAVRVEEFSPLRPCAEDDPQRLHGRVMKALDHYFLTRGSTYLSGQREALSAIVKTVLDDSRQGVPREIARVVVRAEQEAQHVGAEAGHPADHRAVQHADRGVAHEADRNAQLGRQVDLKPQQVERDVHRDQHGGHDDRARPPHLL